MCRCASDPTAHITGTMQDEFLSRLDPIAAQREVGSIQVRKRGEGGEALSIKRWGREEKRCRIDTHTQAGSLKRARHAAWPERGAIVTTRLVFT